jgi:hypothetical protein
MARNKFLKENSFNKDSHFLIAEMFETRVVAFNPDLANVLGSVKAGLLLSQLLYWHRKGSNPEWTYKTIEEMKEETALSRSEQETAIKICEKYKVIEKKLMGIPARRHFKIDIEKIINLLETPYLKTHKQVGEKSTNRFSKMEETNTDNTSNNTNKEYSSSGKKKPYFRGEEMRWYQDKWWVIPEEGGQWLEFAGEKNEIDWKITNKNIKTKKSFYL